MRRKLFHLFILLTVFCNYISAQNYEERYAECSKDLKAWHGDLDSIYFARLHDRDSCLTGSIAPDFTATSVDGQKIELSKLQGQVIVLNFWFTKCQACIEEMPALNKLVDYYSGKKVKFISFAPEDSSTLQTFFLKHPFKFTAIAKSELIRQNKFKLFSIWPYSIIIDQKGRINKMSYETPHEEVFDYYRKAIDKLL